MDPGRFDALARLAAGPTRRRLLAAALALLLGAAPAKPDAHAVSKRRRQGPDDRADDRRGSGSGARRRPADAPPGAERAGGSAAAKRRKPKKCPKGKLKCGKKCVNPKTDALNCGRCGNACGNGIACTNGTCGGPCPGDQIRCGNLCVDPQTDDAHCGGCTRPCQGGQTCRGGECGCAAGETPCGADCADLRTDDDHCGTCDNACGAGEECRAGSCVATGCPPGQTQCPGTANCIPEAETCCRVDFDCGGFNGDLTCDEATSRCVCMNADEGVCLRNANGFGLCDVCCPGGAGSCPGDQVCIDVGTTGLRSCACPAGTERCAGSTNSFLCQRNRGANDNRRCGVDCIDCAAQGRECCNGRCNGGAPPGSIPNPSQLCAGCEPCPEGTGCCAAGGGSPLFGCVVLDGRGACPSPSGG